MRSCGTCAAHGVWEDGASCFQERDPYITFGNSIKPVLQSLGHIELGYEAWTGHVQGILEQNKSRVQESSTGGAWAELSGVGALREVGVDGQAMRKSKQESETEKQYKVVLRPD